MKSLLIFSVIFFLSFIGASCSNSDDSSYTPSTSEIVVFTANLVPVIGTGSMAYGDATLKFNQTAKTFDITVNFTGITPIDGHIHVADSGTIVFPFPQSAVATSPINLSFGITDAQIAQLMANRYYVNLHTSAFTGGEISGTLIKAGTSGGGGGGYP